MCISQKAYDYCLIKSMQFIQGNNRYQTFIITLEEQISANNAVRLMMHFLIKWICKSWVSINFLCIAPVLTVDF